MARKQNKSVKVTKKDSSISINAKKGGKVQKKVQDIKAKKKTESQVKQALKKQGKQTKSPTKAIISPVNAGRRNSRNNSDKTKTSSTPASQRTKTNRPTIKVSTTAKAVKSPKTSKIQSANKKKNNFVEQPQSKKASPRNLQKSGKNEASSSGQNKAGDKMSLRGKKRSYAQLVKDNITEETNTLKKRKTIDSKQETSRGNRSIKPTVKGSEWRNAILQKKSTSAQQEKTKSKASKTSLKSKTSKTVSKSPIQNKKTSPRTLAAQTKAVSKTPTKSKRQSRGGVKTKEDQNLSPSNNQAKNLTKSDSPQNKSSKSRSTSRRSVKSTENENDSLKETSLATSIKDKFSSCMSNKRKSVGCELQENVLVAQGILNDILCSVGCPDISPDDTNSEDQADAKSDTTVLPLKESDQGEYLKSKLEIDKPLQINNADSEAESNNKLMEIDDSVVESFNPSQTTNAISKTESYNKLMEIDDSVADSLNFDKKPTLELNPDPNTLSTSLELKKTIDVDKDELLTNENIDENNTKNDTLEEIELHLSDVSTSSINDSDLTSSENKSTANSNIKMVNGEEPLSKNEDMTDSVLVSKKKYNQELALENKLSEPIENEKVLHINGMVSSSDSTKDIPLHQEVKESVQMPIQKEEFCQQQDNSQEELSLEKTAFPSCPEISDSLEPVTANSSSYTDSSSNSEKPVNENVQIREDSIQIIIDGVDKRVSHQQDMTKDSSVLNSIALNTMNKTDITINKKEDILKLANEINHGEQRASHSTLDLEGTSNISKKKSIENDTQICLNGETVNLKTCIDNETNSKKDLSIIEHHKDEKVIKIAINSNHISSSFPTHNNPQNGPNSTPNTSESLLGNDKLMINGDKGIPPGISSKVINGSVPDSTFITEQLISSDNQIPLEISKDDKETKQNDFVVGKVKTDVSENNTCLQRDVAKINENSTSLVSNLMSENMSDKLCSENKAVSKVEIKSCTETSKSLETIETKELKSRSLEQKIPEAVEDSEVPHNYVEGSNKMVCDAQKVGNDSIAVSNVNKSPNCTKSENSKHQEFSCEKGTLNLDITSNHAVDSTNSITISGEETCSAVNDSTDKTENGSDSPSENIVTEVLNEISSNVPFEKIISDTPADHSNKTEELKLSSGNAAYLLENVIKENSSSSSHTEQISDEEKTSLEDSQGNKESENSTNSTEEVSKVSLEATSSSFSTEMVSFGESGHSNNKPPLQTSCKDLTSVHSSAQAKSTNLCSSNAESVTDALIPEETSEELIKMEEENQEEMTQDSIIVDDTDGKSMQCGSETHSNRMSIEEEAPCMEVGAEGLTATVNTCSTIEMNMEVS